MGKIKGLVSSLLLLFILVAIVGCGGNKRATEDGHEQTSNLNEKEGEKSKENPFAEAMELSIAVWDIESSLSDTENDEIYKMITEKFNISIKPLGITWDDYAQKIQMWAASNQLPDIFSIDAVGSQYYRKWVTQGIVKALPEDLSKYPYLKEYLNTDDIMGLKENGKLFAIPRKTWESLKYNSLDRVIAYRWDWAKAAGIEKEPETWEEFSALLKAVMEKNPEGTQPVGLTAGNVKLIGGFFWLYSNPAATSDGSGNDFKWIKEDGKFIPAVFSKGALSALNNMKDMNKQGLIDPDIGLIKGDQGYDKFASGKAVAILHAGGFLNSYKKILKERWSKIYPDNQFMDSVKVLKPLKSVDGKRYHPVFKTYWSESYFSGKISEQKMDRILSLYDFLVSKEGRELVWYGIKDADYGKSGETIEIIETEPLYDKYPSLGLFQTLAEWNLTDNYDMNNPAIADPDVRKAGVEYIDWVKQNTVTPEFDIRLTYMSTPTKDKFTVFDHDDLLNVLLSKKSTEEAWEQIIESYKAKGLDKMIEEVNLKAKELGIE